MAIGTFDGFVASAKQNIGMSKMASRTAISTAWFSVFDLAGNPGAGVLAGTSVAAGVVPTDATAGCPVIDAFGGGAAGYISNVDFGSSVACRMRLWDMLFKAGAYAFNAAQALAAQPSYASRIPGANYKGTEIWFECVTAFTGNLTLVVTYTNQDGTTGKSTGTFAPAVAPSVGRMFKLPLAAGDSGVQKIESVTSTVATAGTFNILVLEPLWSGRVRAINDGDNHSLDKTAMPVVYADSALFMAINADSSATGIPEMDIVISNG